MDLLVVEQRIQAFVEAHPRTNLARGGVRLDDEYQRIRALRRREWSAAQLAYTAQRLSEIVRINPDAMLREKQAQALYELVEIGGLLGWLRVGIGKTLIGFLAGRVLGAKRPLLLVPAKLRDKTHDELAECALDWRVSSNLVIQSYEWLGLPQAEEYLDELEPDLIVADEAHKLRNIRTASRVARVKRWVRKCRKENRRFHFVAMSGTLIDTRLQDWAHLSEWALGEHSPAPLRWGTVEHWGRSLNHDACNPPGVLSSFGDDYRSGYQQFVERTPGVIVTRDGFTGVGLEITIERIDNPYQAAIAPIVKHLRDWWQLPDGVVLDDPKKVARAVRQLALGVYYRWRVPAPEAWLIARRRWSCFVRHCIRYAGGHSWFLDSPKQVALMCAADYEAHAMGRPGKLDRIRAKTQDDEIVGPECYAAWRDIRDTFKPEVEYVWVTHDIVRALVERTKREHSTLWFDSVAAGLLAESMGLPYFGREGLDCRGRKIEDCRDAYCASISSNGEGRNLQHHHSSMIIPGPSGNASRMEQLLGRVHRDEQKADTVEVAITLHSEQHEAAWAELQSHAEFLQQSTGCEQKLKQATIIE